MTKLKNGVVSGVSFAGKIFSTQWTNTVSSVEEFFVKDTSGFSWKKLSLFLNMLGNISTTLLLGSALAIGVVAYLGVAGVLGSIASLAAPVCAVVFGVKAIVYWGMSGYYDAKLRTSFDAEKEVKYKQLSEEQKEKSKYSASIALLSAGVTVVGFFMPPLVPIMGFFSGIVGAVGTVVGGIAECCELKKTAYQPISDTSSDEDSVAAVPGSSHADVNQVLSRSLGAVPPVPSNPRRVLSDEWSEKRGECLCAPLFSFVNHCSSFFSCQKVERVDSQDSSRASLQSRNTIV